MRTRSKSIVKCTYSSKVVCAHPTLVGLAAFKKEKLITYLIPYRPGQCPGEPSSSLLRHLTTLAALVPDLGDDAEATGDEEEEDGREDADASPLVAQHVALQAVEVEDGDLLAVVVDHGQGLAVGLAFELVEHHRGPTVPDEGGPAVPRPLVGDLLQGHDEPR